MSGPGDKSFAEEYDRKRPTHEDLAHEVDFAIVRAIEAKRLKIHSVTTRVKTRESFLEKVTRKSYNDPWTQMVDLVGSRIICLFIDDLPTIDSIIRSAFDVLDSEDKSKSAPPELLKYHSIHYECRFKTEYSGPRYDSIKNIIFEIQSRTILQDAWASVEHHLAYKGEASVPESLRRDFSALVGLFHVADKQFQQLYYESEKTDSEAVDAVASTDQQVALEFNRSTLTALLQKLFPDRARNDQESYSDLTEELAEFSKLNPGAELSQIRKLEDMLQKGLALGEASEQANPPGIPGDPSRRFADVGIARTILDEIVPGYSDWRHERFRRKNADNFD